MSMMEGHWSQSREVLAASLGEQGLGGQLSAQWMPSARHRPGRAGPPGKLGESHLGIWVLGQFDERVNSRQVTEQKMDLSSLEGGEGGNKQIHENLPQE